MSEGLSVIETILRARRGELLAAWVSAQLDVPGVRTDLLSADELRVESDRFLTELSTAVAAGTAGADLPGLVEVTLACLREAAETVDAAELARAKAQLKVALLSALVVTISIGATFIIASSQTLPPGIR